MSRGAATTAEGLLTAWFRMPGIYRDLALAVVLTIYTQAELSFATGVAGSMVVQRASFAAMTGAVVWRRVAPVVAGALAGGGLAAQTVFGGHAPVVGGFVSLLIVTYSAAAHASRVRAAVSGVLVGVGVIVYPFVHDLNLADEIGNAAIFIGTWTLGRVIHHRGLQVDELELRASETEAERSERLRAAVAEERDRIARELHDVVAHSVSVMTLQTGAARQQMDVAPDRTREALVTVERTGRQALEEMHRLLTVLRDHDLDDDTPLANLSELDRLSQQTRQAGLPNDVTVIGDPRPLPPGLELCAYRIIQESLTNSLKHADGTRAWVQIAYGPRSLEISVRDDGRGGRARPGRTGHGLIGMRERVSLFGGELQAGPADGGGWQVQARLPTGPDL